MPVAGLYKVWGLRLTCMLAALGAGCAPVPTRPERSTLGCATAIVRDRIPKGLADKQQHCLAAGLIARHCSRSEAWLVASGKEIGDLLGRGDAEWADWQADRAGIRCAANGASEAQIISCCGEYLETTIGFQSQGAGQR